MTAIVNTKLILEDGIIFDGALTYEGGRITALGRAADVAIPEGAEIIDAGGMYTAPGLIDIHNHGGGEHLFADDPAYCADYFIRHGVTTVLPTFYHDMSLSEMLEGAERIRESSKTGVGRIIAGIHMEGPFMSLFGSGQSGIKWSGAVREEDVRALVDGIGDLVRIWAIDPDRENIECFLDYVKAKHPEAILAHGHSTSTSEAIRAVKKYGVRLRTHIMDCGMTPGRAQGTYGAGGDQFCLYEPDQYAELICDEGGVHVAPDMIKLIVRTKGVRRVILISDSSEVHNGNTPNTEAGVWYGRDLNYDDEGMLAGSIMTLDGAVRNMMTHTGYGLCHAIRMASLNPAELLGIDGEVGSLAVGKRANLILIDDAVNVKRVVLEGETVI